MALWAFSQHDSVGVPTTCPKNFGKFPQFVMNISGQLPDNFRKIVCASRIPPRQLAAGTRRLGGSGAWRLRSSEAMICWSSKPVGYYWCLLGNFQTKIASRKLSVAERYRTNNRMFPTKKRKIYLVWSKLGLEIQNFSFCALWTNWWYSYRFLIPKMFPSYENLSIIFNLRLKHCKSGS